MKQMKKFLAVLLVFVLVLLPLAGCQKTPSSMDENVSSQAQSSAPESAPEYEGIAINVMGLKGPTALGMLGLMGDAEDGTAKNEYHFALAGAPDEITGKLVNGEVDIAAVPTNLASVLYNKTEGGVTLLALNTLGVLYLVTKGEEVTSVEELKGKTIYATGEGSTPQYALEYVLTQNGLKPGEDVQIVYKAEHAEILPLLVSGQANIALLPQPFVTQALTKDEGIAVALDWTEEWEKAVDDGSELTMGCVVVRTAFLQENKAAVDMFLQEYAQSVEYVNANVAEAAVLSEKFDVIAAAVAEKAIPQCNIVLWTGEKMQKAAEGFLKVLFEKNPQAVGGQLPDESFYYRP